MSDTTERWQSRAVADSYDAERFCGPIGRWFDRAQKRALSRCLTCLGSGRVLADVPCGTGRMFPVLSRAAGLCIGLDVSVAMMAKARCREGSDRFRLVCADARALPMADASVDCVVSVRFAMHLASDERVAILREFGRVSRRWVVVEYGYDSAWHRIRGWMRTVLLWLGGRTRTYPQATLGRQIEEEARQADLHITDSFWTLPILSQSTLVVMAKTVASQDPGPSRSAAEPRR
ncbi:MAG: class I SAM-dependent methyltransferase [Planctomycetes bacterium]|nr:class I SAM-dependent methyltransferase [Planctomycetota bacterium]